jgi:NNP family nitrate/nitrite transporter-like MFS transporter
MIGEIGALGGSLLPNVMGYSKQHTGSFSSGWVIYAVIAIAVLGMMRIVSRKWTRTWVGPGGRVLASSATEQESVYADEAVEAA